MKNPSNIRTATLVAALTAVAATAWAMNESQETTLPQTYVAAEPSMASAEATQAVPAPPTTTVPVVEHAVTQPPLTIEERRLSLDERIQGDVMDALLHAPNISGKIGVESRDAVVTLTGYTSTRGQAYRAGNAAGGVMGVKYVQNEIRPRIGGSI
jgi:hypothetical protein